MKTIGVIGAGTMGSGIAYLGALAKFEVRLYDLNDSILETARTKIRDNLAKGVEKKLLSADDAKNAEKQIHLTTDISHLAPSDVVIEAAAEDLKIKQELFKKLSHAVRPSAILATNTSSLSITEIASAIDNPERMVGLHFFNPAHIMKLVEVVYGHRTSMETVAAVVDLAKRFGKQSVLVKDTPGFIVNRVARPFYGEALRLLGEGVSSVEEIDRIVRLEGGFKMGPFELMDLIGIDVNYAVTKSVYEQFFHEPRFRPHPIQKQMVDAGMIGKKVGKGFYDYGKNDKK